MAASSEEGAFRSLIEGLDAVVFRADGASLSLTYVSSGAQRLLGLSPGSPPREAQELVRTLALEDRESFLQLLRKVAADGLSRTLVLRAVVAPSAGRRLRFEVHTEGERSLRGLAGSIVELAEPGETERSFREREQWLHLIVGQLPVVVWTTDTDMRLTSLLGPGIAPLEIGAPQEWIGRTVEELSGLVAMKTGRWGEAHRRAFEGETTDYPEEARGHAYRVRVAPFRSSEGQLVGAIGAAVDVTETVRAQEATDRAQRALGELVDTVEGIVWQSHFPGFRFRFVSKQAERLLGYPLEKWLEPDFWVEHLHPDDRDWAVRFCEQQIELRRPHEFEYRMRAADGRVVWIRDLVSVEPEETSGEVLSGIMVDVTRQKELERERVRLLEAERGARRRAQDAERRQSFLAEAGRILAATLDYDAALRGVAGLAIPDFADWCDVDALTSSGEVRTVAVAHREPELQKVGEGLLNLVPALPWPPQSPRQERIGRAWLARELSEADLAAVCRDRPELLEILHRLGAQSAVAAPLEARGRHLGQIYLVYGRSGRRYEAADAVLLEELASRAALAIDNARLYQESQQAIRTRDEFLAVASHELRTPCAALQLGVQRLSRLERRKSLEQVPPAVVRGILDSAQRQTRRLGGLVENLLDAANLGAEELRLKLESVDLTAVARESAADLREDLSRAGYALSIHAEGPVVGRWDRVRLAQVVSQLLANAVKYGEGRPVDLTVEEDRGVARLQVIDRGMGIPPDHQATIFEPFGRAVSASHYGGLGLGLYIVKRTVSALGGEIVLDSQPGEGTRVTVLLPVAGPASASADAQAAAPPVPGSLL